jgi:hypothetical protein
MASTSSQRPWVQSLVCFGLASLLATVLAGCGGSSTGPQRLAVSGAVTLAGTPVAEGSIKFVPSPGTTGPVAATMIRDGRYSLPAIEGPVRGAHQVIIEVKPARPAQSGGAASTGPKGGGASNSVFYETTVDVNAGTLDVSVEESQRVTR